MSAVYVGKLLAVRLEGHPPVEVAPCVIGVDPELGIVQASDRPALRSGDYWEPCAGSRGRACDRLWYERRRVEYPNDRLWYHDLDDCRAYFTPGLDIHAIDSHAHTSELEQLPRVTLIGPDVETCPEAPGDFLCG